MSTNTASHVEAGGNIASPVRPGDVVADKYLIEETLGVGGMGVVVAARDQLLDRRVAIKFLLPKLAGSDTAVQRFTREARAATRVSSEHVVRLLEIEKLPSGTPFFVMEYLEGSDLRALLRERGALVPRLAVDYALQALQAVAEGHVKGVIHRDIKPGNLFLTSRADGTPLIKVLDFGIAKTLESDAAESNSLTSSEDVRLGSPAYMPPEQLRNPRDVDKRSDIWSLGATLYELLCGRPPFEGGGYLELASRILSQPPIPLSAQPVPNALPDGLEAILYKCLEKERADRYPNAAELAGALAPFGSDDARVSLARITGMFNSYGSIPALTRSVSQDANTCTATLEVPTGSAGTPPDARVTSNIGGVESTPPPRQGKSWLVIAAATFVIAVVFMFRGPTQVAPHSNEAAAATLPPHVDSAPVAAGREAVRTEPVATTAPVSAPIQAIPVVEKAEPAAAPHASTPQRATAAQRVAEPSGKAPHVVSPSVTASPSVAPSAAASPAVAPSVAAERAAAPSVSTPSAKSSAAFDAAPPTAPSASPVGGRSAEIERLIEVRR